MQNNTNEPPLTVVAVAPFADLAGSVSFDDYLAAREADPVAKAVDEAAQAAWAADELWSSCSICFDPIDYCQGHGTIG